MAMGESWLISVIMRFTSNGARIMNEMAGATTKANAAVDAQTAKIARATAAMEAYRMKMLQIGTTASGVIALAGAAVVIAGTKMAADLQTALAGINVATYYKDPRAMRNLVLSTSGITAQSQVTIAEELQTLASAGFNRTSQLQGLFPQFAKAADVAWQLNPNHPDPIETVKQLAKFSHLLGVYSGPKVKDMVDSAIKLLYLQPGWLGSDDHLHAVLWAPCQGGWCANGPDFPRVDDYGPDRVPSWTRWLGHRHVYPAHDGPPGRRAHQEATARRRGAWPWYAWAQ